MPVRVINPSYNASGFTDALENVIGGTARVAGKVLTSDTTKEIAKNSLNAAKNLFSGAVYSISDSSNTKNKLSVTSAVDKLFSTPVIHKDTSITNSLLKNKSITDSAANIFKGGFETATKIGDKILSGTPDVLGNIKNNFQSVDKSNLFSGLKNITSSVVDKIGDLDNSIVNVDINKLAEFASSERIHAKNYQGHFDTWLSLLGKIADNQLLKGAFEGKSVDALARIRDLSGRFTEYMDGLSSKLPSLGERIADADKSFLSLDGDFNLVKGFFAGIGSAFGMGTDSGGIIAGVAGATEDLKKSLINGKGQVHTGRGVSNQVTNNNAKYETDGKNTNHKASDHQLSSKEKELLIYLAYHEAGGDPIQAAAIMSSFLNGWEKSGQSFGSYMGNACSQWSAGDDFKASTGSYRTGNYTYNDVTSLDKYEAMKANGSYKILSVVADVILAGTRTVNATQWNGNGRYNTFTHAV